MHERLRASRYGLSHEIQRRLMITFDADEYDTKTRLLGDAVLWFARQIQTDTGVSWHKNSKACDALIAAVQTYLAAWVRPESEERDFEDDPPTLGRALARRYISDVREHGIDLHKYDPDLLAEAFAEKKKP